VRSSIRPSRRWQGTLPCGGTRFAFFARKPPYGGISWQRRSDPDARVRDGSPRPEIDHEAVRSGGIETRRERDAAPQTGTLKSGRGGKGGTVTSRKQAIAIGLSEARKKGAKVPRKRPGAR